MNDKVRKDIEKITQKMIDNGKKNKDGSDEFYDTENAQKFKSIIVNHIVPLVSDASAILGRAGCSLNYYSNELAVIRDPRKRIYIQILFYPRGHSKITLGVNAPFLQFSYSPLKENIKITSKISIKSDEPSEKIAEFEINNFAEKKIDSYFLGFLKDVVKFNAQ